MNKKMKYSTRTREKNILSKLGTVVLMLVVLCIGFLLISCMTSSTVNAFGSRGNKAGNTFDMTYTYDKAYINTFDGKIEVDVNNWREWDDGEGLVEVISTTGVHYYTSYENVILINSGKN